MKKAIIIIAILLLTNAVTFFMGVRIGSVGMEKRYESQLALVPDYSGQQIMDAVNSYRAEKKLQTLDIDPELCNNLVERYLAFFSTEATTEGHPGFNAWAESKLKKGYVLVGEVFSPATTVDKVMSGWKGSPGHNEAIINPEYSRACTYAGDRGVVMVLGAK